MAVASEGVTVGQWHSGYHGLLVGSRFGGAPVPRKRAAATVPHSRPRQGAAAPEPAYLRFLKTGARSHSSVVVQAISADGC